MIIEKGYAKINLGLEVVGKREDSYHNLDMIMTTISLYDELYFEEIPGQQIIIECEKMKNLESEKNLVYKAIKLVRNRYNIKRGVKVQIVKRIPELAGLGGGSADAAAALRAINRLWNLGLSLPELANLGLEIGSDVPFCIYNRTARVTGRGELVEFIADMPFTYLLLVFPNFRSSTREVFNRFVLHRKNQGKTTQLQKSIEKGYLHEVANASFNDLEMGINNPEIANIKRDLIQAGALGAVMTGSGSTVCGFCLNTEKNAQQVLQKFNSISSSRFSDYKHRRQVEIYTIRSERKAPKPEFVAKVYEEKKSNELQVLASKQTKAYAMFPLAYQAIWNDHKKILTPLSLWDDLFVQKINHPIVILDISDGTSDHKLKIALEDIVRHLGYGLKVSIKRHDNFRLISSNNYLCTIISCLGDFGSNISEICKFFPPEVQLYKDHQTVYYDSKSKEIIKLGKAVFGYLLLVDLNLKNYKNPRYTKQHDTSDEQINAIIEGIEEKNFYKMALNAFNSLERFDSRKIEEFRGSGYLKRLKKATLHNRVVNAYLLVDGRTLVFISRYEKPLLGLKAQIRNKYKLNSKITSFKTPVAHRTVVSKILKDVPKQELEELIDYEYDEASPFANDEAIFEDYEYERRYRKNRRKKGTPSKAVERDFEGLLSLNSGGSIFKQYDFVDIAKYFLNFFEGRYIDIYVEDKPISIMFKTEHLPHILGIHLIDEEDSSLRGRSGFSKLLKGEITYQQIRKLRITNEKIYREILNKTQSSVMIFNDIFHNRDSFYCFPKEIIVDSDTKMDKFEFGITRMLTGSLFHKQHLLGIGKNQETNTYFFYTSFIWQVPPHIGKKDSYSITIS